MKLKYGFLILVCCVLQFSCSEDDDPAKPTTFALKNLTDKYFIRSSVVSYPVFPLSNGTATTDIYHDWLRDECVLDDLRMFKANGENIFDNGATKCNTWEPQTATYEWQFLSDSTRFWISNGFVNDTMKILVNDGTTLKYENEVIYSNKVFIWVETWKKKE